MVGKWIVEGLNEYGQYQVDNCAEKWLLIAHTFQKEVD